jgi:hypothetical protein
MTLNRTKTLRALLILASIATLVYGCSKESAEPATLSFEDAKSQALEVIAAREQWPATPEDLCRAFWDARAKKDYKEMAILWPGSASLDWPAICKDDPDVTYVFGTASGSPAEVPYASQQDYEEQGTYNLKMSVEAFDTPKGTRHFIASAN